MIRAIRIAATIAVAATLLTPSATHAEDEYLHLVGALHEHSSFSDGHVDTTPATYFEEGAREGLDFMGSAEHSDNSDIPVALHDSCLNERLPDCVRTDTEPKWDATQRIADETQAAHPGYTAFRGFEWTSDRHGHINVFFSRNNTNAKTDGGYASMDSFYEWLTTGPDLKGGADGLAVFNHPGGKVGVPVEEDTQRQNDPAHNWNNFAYAPGADSRMVGLEVFNDDDHFGDFFHQALDKGWHVGAIGAEDIHGDDDGNDDYGDERLGKTVVLAKANSRAAIKDAMKARRFYATIGDKGLRLDLTIDGGVMGSRLARKPGSQLAISASNNRGLKTEIVTSGGTVVGTGNGSLAVTRVADRAEKYYFVRVKDGAGRTVGYSSPIWIEDATTRQWLAGDLHVHTCYSHDSYCGPDDTNTAPEEFYTAGGNVEERFTEARARGLDYLAITDHNSDGSPEESGFQRSIDDPGFGTHGVIGVQGYENSIGGHAQMLGAKRVYPAGNKQAADINAMADALRADGGVFQANHPADGAGGKIEDCNDLDGMHWSYRYDVQPDTIEVWNIGHLTQPPIPSMTPNHESIVYWECWLNRGAKIGATGGSDSHWLSTTAVQGPGNPTTWVYSHARTDAGILKALREGRTTISAASPRAGGPRLILEGDADGDGTFEAIIGDEIPASGRVRARVEGTPQVGLVTIRANGVDLVKDQPITSGAAVEVSNLPPDGGWVRATLKGPDLRAERSANCEPQIGDQTTYCRSDIALLALTSPIYLKATPIPTVLTYAGATRVVGNAVLVGAKLADTSGDPIVGKTITFTNRGTVVSAVTDMTGRAITTMPMPDHGKQQRVVATFAGEGRYEPSQVSATVSWGR